MFNLKKISAYSNENAYLRDYLRSGVSSGDFPQHVVKYFEQNPDALQNSISIIKAKIQDLNFVDMNENQLELFRDKNYDQEKQQEKYEKQNLIELLENLENIGFEDDQEDYEIGMNWLEICNTEELKKYEEWLKEQHLDTGNTYSDPSYLTLEYQKYLTATWLVHFTDNASAIEADGFKYGHDEMSDGLHLTTWKSKRKRNPGYNFAFELGDSGADSAAATGKYGEEAIVFWSSGVKAWHSGDEENQIIFWGPSVNKEMIFAVRNDGDKRNGWYVEADNNRVLIKEKTFDEAATWISEHFQEIHNIKERVKRQRNEKIKQRDRLRMKSEKNFNYYANLNRPIQ